MTDGSLITSVAETTSHRDRDDLDRAIALLLLQFLNARSVELFRLVDDSSVKRLVRRGWGGRLHTTSPQAIRRSISHPVANDLTLTAQCGDSRSIGRLSAFGTSATGGGGPGPEFRMSGHSTVENRCKSGAQLTIARGRVLTLRIRGAHRGSIAAGGIEIARQTCVHMLRGELHKRC